MIKKVYHISGFDCPSCASKTETFLNKQKGIEKSHIDFATNKMFVTYDQEAFTIEKLMDLIAKVESGPITLKEADDKENEKGIILFTGDMWYAFYRVLLAIVVLVVNLFIINTIDPTGWIRFSLYLVATILLIYDVSWRVILHIRHRQNIIDHNLLISLAVFGAIALSIIFMSERDVHKSVEFLMEGMMIVGFFQIGLIIEKYATNKSKLAVMNAVQLRVEYANILKGNEVIRVNPEDLEIDDIVVISAGEMIPVDGEIIEGRGYINKSSLTGEFVPVLGDSEHNEVFAGCLVEEGFIKVKVTKRYEDSAVAKIIKLISYSGENKSKADEFIAKFARYYTPIIVLLSVVVFLTGGLITKDWRTYFVSGLMILVTGCPCAIVISVPLAYFAAIGLASKRGIVIKGTNYLDEINKIGKVITDKTGTLTHGVFSIQKIAPAEGVLEDELMNALYAVESLSTHPIAKAICHGVDIKAIAAKQVDFKEIAGSGVTTINDGQRIYAGNAAFMKESGVLVKPNSEQGVIVHAQKDGKYLGYIILNDKIKKEAYDLVKLLHKEKMAVILLTGDRRENSLALQKELGIDRVYSELTPADKVNILEREMSDTHKNVAFVGDGINDAPSIMRSDVGFAMGAIGSDIAVENADIVIMNDNPVKVYESVKIARTAQRTAIFNIVSALLIKFIVFILVIIPGVNLPMEVPVIADTGLTVALVINSLLILYRRMNNKVK